MSVTPIEIVATVLFGLALLHTFMVTRFERLAHRYPEGSVGENLFHRHPNLRVASVENGSGFLRGLFSKLQITAKKMQGWFPEDPVETFRRHVWINPFWEDDVDEVLELVGADRVIFGSDWPHIEALPEPLHYLRDVAHLDVPTQQKLLRDNARYLNTPRPA